MRALNVSYFAASVDSAGVNARFAESLGLKTIGEKEKQLIGLLYDRDVVAFSPAMSAELK